MFRSIQKNHRARAALMGVLALLCYAPLSQASLTLSTTRVVFDSDKRSASLIVANPSDKVFAVQSWVNTSADDTTTAVPFVTSPLLFSIGPGKEQQVQINRLPNTLPTDRETLFYFNAQEIPQAEADQSNVLNIAIRTRIKFFYRPAQLKQNPSERLKDLQWSLQTINGKPSLVLHNPTPFHYTFQRLEVSSGGRSKTIDNPTMAAPLSREIYALGELKTGTAAQVSFTTINDYGGITPPITLPLRQDR
ncbi:fimbrial biogenesis chaperone [Pseudomonas sp. EA_15y_Pfl2_R67]|uniref:fimbrial biogenesis chaperone n=1 Tax=Pseudomonas sp. EA_15y_Pfl2_R67 TaxID=3088687 RepID=UPI0030DB21EF